MKNTKGKIITSSLDHIDKRILVYQPSGLIQVTFYLKSKATYVTNMSSIISFMISSYVRIETSFRSM